MVPVIDTRMRQFDMVNCAMFFLLLLFFATITEAYDDTVTVRIRNMNRQIVLNWKLTDQYLANNNLPIWSAFKDTEPTLIPHVMENVGPFAMYHDVSKSSAVVFFHNTQSFFGVIDTRFYITGLPYSMVGPNFVHTINGPYVKRRAEDSFHDYPSFAQSPPPPNIGNMNFYPIPEVGPSSRHPQMGHHTYQQRGRDILFAEILVLVSHDIVNSFNWELPELAKLVKLYIVYFNSIDMIYAKLTTNGIRIHLNIAGVVLETKKHVFPYVFHSASQESVITPQETLSTFFKYMKKYKKQFPEDSYDFFFLSTGYPIVQGVSFLAGFAQPYNVYKNKKTKSCVHKLPGVIVQNREYFSDIFTAAHELAHTMHVLHDELTYGIHSKNNQCFGMMQPIGSYCKYCINWSLRSILQFRKYIRNRDRCPLLNPPRSLQRYGTVMPTLTPMQQCHCYQHLFHADDGGDASKVFPHRCDKKLECTNLELIARPYIVFPLPVDGTPCGENKVCWGKECKDITIQS